MFQFPAFALQQYLFLLQYRLLCGFPHSDIYGSRFVHNSPYLFAVYYVLLRLWVPRHSPNALTYRLILRINNLLFVFLLQRAIYTQQNYPFYIIIKGVIYFYFFLLLRFYSNSLLLPIYDVFYNYLFFLVEVRRIELLTPCLQSRCSPSWAIPPLRLFFRSSTCLQQMPWVSSLASAASPASLGKIAKMLQTKSTNLCWFCLAIPAELYPLISGGSGKTWTSDLTLIRRAL